MDCPTVKEATTLAFLWRAHTRSAALNKCWFEIFGRHQSSKIGVFPASVTNICVFIPRRWIVSDWGRTLW
jgi:hypothetical protein